MASYIRFDFINDNKFADIYDNLKELLEHTNYFYHETFRDEEEYNENKEFKTLKEAIILWEGSGYGIARIMK